MGKEYRIVIPLLPFTDEGHYIIQMALTKRFGGFTVVQGTGGWMAESASPLERENVMVYTVSIDPESFLSLRDFAGWVREKGEQDCVHFCFPNGDVLPVDKFVEWVRTPWLRTLTRHINALKRSFKE